MRMMSEEQRFFDRVYKESSPVNYAGPCPQKRIDAIREETLSWLNVSGLSKRPSACVLEIGCGLANMKDIHPGWHGVEVSANAVKRVKDMSGNEIRIYCADAENLPFPSAHFDGVYSWAVFEHLRNPSAGFHEVDRVCRKGGWVLMAPAWNCRSWTVKKLPQVPYRVLGGMDKFRKATIPFRNSIVFRAIRCFPWRLFDEIKLLLKKTLSVRYKPLYPRWDLIELLGHVSDDDALADIDPHSAICFFKSRGYAVVSHPNLLSRLLARHEPVIAVKK